MSTWYVVHAVLNFIRRLIYHILSEMDVMSYRNSVYSLLNSNYPIEFLNISGNILLIWFCIIRARYSLSNLVSKNTQISSLFFYRKHWFEPYNLFRNKCTYNPVIIHSKFSTFVFLMARKLTKPNRRCRRNRAFRRVFKGNGSTIFAKISVSIFLLFTFGFRS